MAKKVLRKRKLEVVQGVMDLPKARKKIPNIRKPSEFERDDWKAKPKKKR